MEDLSKDDIKQVEASDADEKVVEVYRILARYKNAPARKDWIDRREDCWKAAVENAFFTDDEINDMAKMKQTPVSMNWLNKGIQGSAAIVTDSKPEVRFNPVGKGDVYVADLMRRAHEFVWLKNDGNDEVYSMVEENKIGGHAFIEALHDPSAGMFGRLVFEELDPTIMYWDANSRKRDYSDTHLIKAQLRTKKYIKDNYENIKDDDLTFQTQLIEDPGRRTDTKTGEDNYAMDPGKSDATESSTEPPRNIWEIEAWLLNTVREDWMIYQIRGEAQPQTARIDLKNGQTPQEVMDDWASGQDVEFVKHWPRKMKKRLLRVIVGKKIIDQTDPDSGKQVKERENPYGEDADGDPILPIIGLKGQRTLNSYCTSPTFYAKDVNKSLCRRQIQFIYAATQALNAPIVRDENARWDGPKGVAGSELILGKNTVHVPFRLPPENVPLTNIAQLIEQDKQYIDDQYDLQDVMKGKPPKGQENASGRFILALQGFGGMMSKPSLRALESALVRLAKVNMAIILQTWPRHMWERLLEDDERETPVDEKDKEELQQAPDDDRLKEKVRRKWAQALELIRPGDPTKPAGITLIDLDVQLTAGSSMPTNRMARQQVSLEMYTAGLYDRKAALEYSDDPKAEEIADRMDEKDMQMAQMGLNK